MTWQWIMAVVIALVGTGIAAMALFRDGLRHGRPPPRRCPRCWYAMDNLPDRTCPECGYQARTEERLHAHRRRWKLAVLGLLPVLLLAAAATNHVVSQRRGGWWSLAPTSMLLNRLEKLGTPGPRDALGARIDDGDPQTGLSPRDRLTRDQWARFASICDKAIQDWEQPKYMHSWAAVTLGMTIPHEDLVDPVIHDLLMSDMPGVRMSGLWCVYPYFLERGHLSTVWLPDLVEIASDAGSADEAKLAAIVLVRVDPLPIESLRTVASDLRSSSLDRLVWNAMLESIENGHSPPADRIAFLVEMRDTVPESLLPTLDSTIQQIEIQIPSAD